jgi:hypothetical protein
VAPGLEERLLDDLLGVVVGGQHPVGVDHQLGPEPLDQPAEGGLVAGPGGGGPPVEPVGVGVGPGAGTGVDLEAGRTAGAVVGRRHPRAPTGR